MAKQLTLFQKNDPMPRPEQTDENWTQNYIENILPILLDHLWNGLLNSWVLSDRTVILMAGRHAQIPYLENMRILPALVKTTHVSKVEESVTMASRTHLFFADLLSRHLPQQKFQRHFPDRRDGVGPLFPEVGSVGLSGCLSMHAGGDGPALCSRSGRGQTP